MKYLVFFLTFTFGGLVYSHQTGTQLIYQSGNFGIGMCNSVKLNNTGIKQLYIQHGLYNYTSGMNESGRYLLLNKNNGNRIIPHNGFINAGWGVYLPEYSCTPIPFFAITIKIFDLLGREISTLVNEKLNPGTYETRFDASDLPSGIYFYRMQTENYISTKKLILLK